jgi:predicted RNase H-like HicB family nuclease
MNQMGYKAYSDGYLMSLTKDQIIELLRVAEHNFFATEEALNNSAKAGMEIAEKYDKAKELLKLTIDDAHRYGEYLPEEDALYVSVPEKGGASLLVANDGTVLYANSSVHYDIHLREFRNGRRTPIDAFGQRV